MSNRNVVITMQRPYNIPFLFSFPVIESQYNTNISYAILSFLLLSNKFVQQSDVPLSLSCQ